MATSQDDIDRMQAAMTDDDTPAWSTPDDLSRISGDGVTGAARVSEVAGVVAGFQRLATAVGVTQQGDKAPGRQPNADVRRRTDLPLRSPPGHGSIILTVTLPTSPIRRRRPRRRQGRHVRRDRTEDQLLDTAIGAAIDVFSAANDVGPSPHNRASCKQLAEMGPRIASALRDLSKTLDRPLRHRNRLAETIARQPPRHGVVNCSRLHRLHRRKRPTSMSNPCTSSANISPSTPSPAGSSSKTTETPSANSEKSAGQSPRPRRRRPRRYRRS